MVGGGDEVKYVKVGSAHSLCYVSEDGNPRDCKTLDNADGAAFAQVQDCVDTWDCKDAALKKGIQGIIGKETVHRLKEAGALEMASQYFEDVSLDFKSDKKTTWSMYAAGVLKVNYYFADRAVTSVPRGIIGAPAGTDGGTPDSGSVVAAPEAPKPAKKRKETAPAATGGSLPPKQPRTEAPKPTPPPAKSAGDSKVFEPVGEP